jgi:IS5 family transposase
MTPNLSDPGAEDALYESPVLRHFAGVDLGRAAAPDETTILRFRRMLETQELCGQILLHQSFHKKRSLSTSAFCRY